MKRKITIITIVTLFLSLFTACGNKDETSSRQNDSIEKNIQNTTEYVEIEESEAQISAVDLINKTIPEIIDMMNGEYQIIQTEMGGYYDGHYNGIFYIQNQSVFPGMEFYVETVLDEKIDCNYVETNDEIHSENLRKILESGEYALDGIQVNKYGKATDTICADMNYVKCSEILGDFSCVSSGGGIIGGSPIAVAYTYNEKNAEVTIHFDETQEIANALRLSSDFTISSEKMKSSNPVIRNVVIKKQTKVDKFLSLSLGNGYSGCIGNNGSLYMWGSNLCGNLGNGTYEDDSLTPIKIMDNVKFLSLNNYYSAAIKENGSLYMWGSNEHGKLGNGTTNDSSTPIKIMDNVKFICTGYNNSAAITEDGSLYTWGSNEYGKLGNGTTNDSSIPVKILDNVEAVSLSSNCSGAITEDGSLYMWGGNWCYQLGNGTNEDSSTPIKIMDNVKSISLGYGHNAAITEDDSLYMWGYNDKGQIGNRTTATSPEPVKRPLKIMDNVKSVSLGSDYSGAITEDGSLYMWGDNFYNQLGYSTAKSSTPTKIMDNIKSISFAYSQSSAITEDNVLYLWGRETSGKLEDVLSFSIGEFSYGSNHYGIIKTDGSLYMWGDNKNGELGNGESGAFAKSSNPIKININ